MNSFKLTRIRGISIKLICVGQNPLKRRDIACLNKLLYCDPFCLQKTCQSANEVRQRADKLIKDGHFDPEAIWNCADNMSRRWQQLMSKSEERRKVVTASYSFFKSAEQVQALFWYWGKMELKMCLSLSLSLCLSVRQSVIQSVSQSVSKSLVYQSDVRSQWLGRSGFAQEKDKRC